MANRGERSFIHLPTFAAKLYSWLTSIQPVQQQHGEIARLLCTKIDHGKLLDIGTGPGFLLKAICQITPAIQLYGLDISPSMLKVAKKNLSGLDIDLSTANVTDTNFTNDFFDLVTCTGSFYLWDNPITGLDEVYRILKPNCCAFLFETVRDYDQKSIQKALITNLRGESVFTRRLTPIFFGKQIKMTYTIEEFEDILSQTKFAENFNFQPITLAGLPNWLCITLAKN